MQSKERRIMDEDGLSDLELLQVRREIVKVLGMWLEATDVIANSSPRNVLGAALHEISQRIEREGE